MTKDEMAEVILALTREEMITALNFLVGNDARAAEDAILYARRITSREREYGKHEDRLSVEESLKLHGRYPP